MSMIIFYKMTGCGYCVKAENMLKSYIESGVVSVVPHTDAPSGVTGFPYFEAPSTGKSHTGCPSSAAELFSVLGLQEPFRFRRAHEGFSRRVIERMNHKKDDSIHFFSMEGCGWCKKAMEILKPLIDNGEVIVKNAEAAPKHVDGFPYFLSSKTGREMSGVDFSNPSEFLKKLGHSHSENFLMGGIGSAVRPMGEPLDEHGDFAPTVIDRSCNGILTPEPYALINPFIHGALRRFPLTLEGFEYDGLEPSYEDHIADQLLADLPLKRHMYWEPYGVCWMAADSVTRGSCFRQGKAKKLMPGQTGFDPNFMDPSPYPGMPPLPDDYRRYLAKYIDPASLVSLRVGDFEEPKSSLADPDSTALPFVAQVGAGHGVAGRHHI